MKIAVLGTGMVGRALARRFNEVGHDVVVATRNVEQTLARTEAGKMGIGLYSEWQKANPRIDLLSYEEAGHFAELVVNATAGASGPAALQAVGAVALDGKVVLDLAVPLDLSAGMPPKLLIANNDSLGEQIQRAFPMARVVKTLNTMFVDVMIAPTRVPGDHNIFLAGNDEPAKETVRTLLAEFGWRDHVMIDLGGIEAARATEMYMQLYFRLVGAFGGNFNFNIAVMRA